MILPARFAAMSEAGALPTILWKHLAEPAWSKLRTCKNCSITSARTVLNTTLRRISPLWCQWFTKRRQTTWVGRCTGTARNGREESRLKEPRSTFKLISWARSGSELTSRYKQLVSNQGGRTMTTITTKDGTQIYYKDWGTGQPIVFSHGWPLSADDWDI